MPDRMARFVTDAGYAAAVVRADETVQTIGRDQHGLADGPLQVLGEAVVASLLLATRLKGPGLLTLSLATDGVFDLLRCDAIGLGSVRGMVLPGTSERLSTWNGADPLVGDGILTVGKQLHDEDQPYQSKLLVGADSVARIANDYLVASEQVPAAIGMSVTPAPDRVRAGGIYLERLPGGDTDHPLMGILLRLRDEPGSIDLDHPEEGAVLQQLCPDATFRHLHTYDVGFHCPCSRDRYISNLRNFPVEQLSELTNGAGVIETVCDFCRTRYPLPLDDLI
jgi:molecular chaperone Hsp33